MEVGGSFKVGGCVIWGQAESAWVEDGGVHGAEFEGGFAVPVNMSITSKKFKIKEHTVCAASWLDGTVSSSIDLPQGWAILPNWTSPVTDFDESIVRLME